MYEVLILLIDNKRNQKVIEKYYKRRSDAEKFFAKYKKNKKMLYMEMSERLDMEG